MNKEILWEQKYRPQTVGECILPERIKGVFREYVTEREIPNLILHGPPGVGKTSIAVAACKEMGCDYLFVNGASDNGIDTIRTTFANYGSSVSLRGGRKVIICDEGDRLSPQAQDALKSSIEQVSKNCSLIITSNHKHRLIDAIISRCPDMDFSLKNSEKSDMAKQIYKRAGEILVAEGVPFNKSVLIEIIKNYFPDFRKIINRLQMFSKTGSIDAHLLTQEMDMQISDLVKKLREKDFVEVRKWVGVNDIDYGTIYRTLYDQLYTFMKPDSIPQAVIILADYQYKQSFASDYDINFMACLTELMASCEF